MSLYKGIKHLYRCKGEHNTERDFMVIKEIKFVIK